MIKFPNVNSFGMSVSYKNLYPDKDISVLNSHFHEECEVYINLSGDVSFAVENKIYSVVPGNIIITRPYEYHHCIYHSKKQHKHFWILISPNGNEKFLDVFYNRKAGEGNLLTLNAQKTDELISLCHKMTESHTDAENYRNFFMFMNLLQNAEKVETNDKTYPADVLYALNYINKHFDETFVISDIAKEANVSINTLERHFNRIFNMSPTAYLRKKRLANSVKLLTEGKTVTEASMQSGFSDCSAFISLFKKAYGTTPFKYKKIRFIQNRT